MGKECNMIKCSVEGCGNSIKVIKHKLCSKHYARWLRHGDVHSMNYCNINSLEKLLYYTIKDNDCLVWTKGSTNGYGRTVINGTIKYVHRAVYEFMNGPIANDLQVNHTCNNRACCNINHLYLGTHYDNMQDKCRAETGNTNKLTANDVIFIRNSKDTCAILAEKFNVSNVTISNVRRNKTWQWVINYKGDRDE